MNSFNKSPFSPAFLLLKLKHSRLSASYRLKISLSLTLCTRKLDKWYRRNHSYRVFLDLSAKSTGFLAYQVWILGNFFRFHFIYLYTEWTLTFIDIKCNHVLPKWLIGWWKDTVEDGRTVGCKITHPHTTLWATFSQLSFLDTCRYTQYFIKKLNVEMWFHSW